MRHNRPPEPEYDEDEEDVGVTAEGDTGRPNKPVVGPIKPKPEPEPKPTPKPKPSFSPRGSSSRKSYVSVSSRLESTMSDTLASTDRSMNPKTRRSPLTSNSLRMRALHLLLEILLVTKNPKHLSKNDPQLPTCPRLYTDLVAEGESSHHCSLESKMMYS